jgi:hypothetical protein
MLCPSYQPCKPPTVIPFTFNLECTQVQRPDVWAQVQVDLAVLLLLLRLLRWARRIKQDITLWADTLGRGLAQELDYMQVKIEAVVRIHVGLGLGAAVVGHSTRAQQRETCSYSTFVTPQIVFTLAPADVKLFL